MKYAEILESYLIPATESANNSNSILSIIKKYPTKYPDELSNYQFDIKGKFDKSVKSEIDDYFFSSNWQKRFNAILSETLAMPQYDQRIKSYCQKTGYKVNDFKIQLDDVYFNDYGDDVKYHQMYINISFDDMDRYDAPGFPQLIIPILTAIVKNDIGKQWIVEKDEYPTRFVIYRPLNATESKVLQEIQNGIDEKKRLAKEKAAESKKLRDQKNTEFINHEISANEEKFYNQSLKDQAMEIVKFFTFSRKYYYDKYYLERARYAGKEIESKKINSDEKIFKFNYIHPNSFDFMNGKPIQNSLICYVITSAASDYKKLEKVYFVDYYEMRSSSFETYIKKKALSKK